MEYIRERILLPFHKVLGIRKRKAASDDPLKSATNAETSEKHPNRAHQTKSMRQGVDVFGRRCNYVSMFWLWITILGVVYFGFEHVLPAIFGEENALWITVNKCCGIFILSEMMLNWFFIKFVRSPFKASDHETYISAHREQIQNGGFEINLDDIKRCGVEGQDLRIPVKSLHSTVSDPSKLKGTLFIVDAEEAKVSLGQDFQLDPNLNSLSENGTTYGDDTNATKRRKIVFPYWSWKPCVICQTPRPPRTHHCSICGTCVLKRDHHCFFTGSCVGLRNQRYFVVFTFWSSVATVYCVILSFAYLILVHVPNNTWWDTVWPILIIRYFLGYVSSIDVLLLTMLYSIAWFCLTAVGFFREQILCIQNGITSFEQDNGIKITNVCSKKYNLAGVFGKYWYLNFLVPLYFKFSQLDDGITWTNIKSL